MRVIYGECLEGGIGLVLVNGRLVYYEDFDDPAYSNELYPAWQLAERLAEALGVAAQSVCVGIPEERRDDWDVSDLVRWVLAELAADRERAA